MCLFTHALERVVFVDNILSSLNPRLADLSLMFAVSPNGGNLCLSTIKILESRVDRVIVKVITYSHELIY